MPPNTQDEIATLRLREAKAQVALARANVEKLEAKRVVKEAALWRSEAAEKEAKKAKKKAPPAPRSTGTAGGEDQEEKLVIVSCMLCRKAKAPCRFYTSSRSTACVRCQEKKAKCEGESPPEGVQVWKRKTQDTVDSNLEEIEVPTSKKKKTEEAPKAGPSKGKERAHLELEPEVEKARPKKITVAEGSLVSRDLFLRVLQESDEAPESGMEEGAEGMECAEEQGEKQSGKGPGKEGEGEGSGESPEGSDGQESGKELEKTGEGLGKGWEGQGPKK
ncbi:hypothetical protein K466DRAFT_616248 [Polyporus arcularius HHB13444]|uniref:Zn(2)-C6 fungal-type domain-containing protein n=1 Tax=Polyporus arcularius HHB13444 TaxID=1314778 RepID=A0A5C3NM56_9APHY|nr:hypothetical protein K466DRAFT_616248 [Polyporus arcularius HHB13444]